MIKQQQLYNIINEYIDKEIAPLSVGTSPMQQFLFGFQLGIIKRKSQTLMKDLLSSPTSKMLHILDGENVDVDTLYGALSDAMSAQGSLEVCGVKFTNADVNKLYSMIRERSYEQVNISNS